ncbi:MAG: DoxX family protein [Flavobacteriales bacterium]|nr:MAG: DoxX family protein [Flavobacteriales bacterium]
MKVIVQILRIIIAAVFIFSGFVKLVDSLGSAYKFEEYFAPDVLNLEFLIPFALPFAILLILAELLLGVFLLIGFKSKLTVVSLFVLTLIFLFLTWYSAYYNKVTDCGCFGDAITLTPWETFYKNVVFIVFIVVIWFGVEYVKPLFAPVVVKWVSFITFLLALLVTYYVLQHLPIIDFRPYAVGKNIPEGMVIPEGAKEAVYEVTWIYNVNGKNRKFTMEEKPWEIEGATFVDRETVLVEKGYEPPIHDFSMEKDGVDFTEFLMQKEKLMLIIMYDIDKVDKSLLPKVQTLTEKAMHNGYDVYAMTASKKEDFEQIKADYNLHFDMLFCDATTLKTIVRANPGIVMLNKGTITSKWNATDADEIKL